MFIVSSCSCLLPIQWSQVFSGEWRCSWSSADRWCSNYIWMVDNFIAYQDASYIRDLTIFNLPDHNAIGQTTASCGSSYLWSDIDIDMKWVKLMTYTLIRYCYKIDTRHAHTCLLIMPLVFSFWIQHNKILMWCRSTFHCTPSQKPFLIQIARFH